MCSAGFGKSQRDYIRELTATGDAGFAKIQCGIRKKLTGLHTGIDGYWRCGIRQNTVRDSEKVNGITYGN